MSFKHLRLLFGTAALSLCAASANAQHLRFPAILIKGANLVLDNGATSCKPTGDGGLGQTVAGATKRHLYSGELEPAKRVTTIIRIIQRNAKLPSKILEADFVEYKKGDGFLGPSDFFFYARIKVAKKDLPQWTKGLKKPYNNSTTYSVPPRKEKWWISEKDFKKLKLYETKKYFGRFNGWIGFDESMGYLYIHTFTL